MSCFPFVPQPSLSELLKSYPAPFIREALPFRNRTGAAFNPADSSAFIISPCDTMTVHLAELLQNYRARLRRTVRTYLCTGGVAATCSDCRRFISPSRSLSPPERSARIPCFPPPLSLSGELTFTGPVDTASIRCALLAVRAAAASIISAVSFCGAAKLISRRRRRSRDRRLPVADRERDMNPVASVGKKRKRLEYSKCFFTAMFLVTFKFEVLTLAWQVIEF